MAKNSLMDVKKTSEFLKLIKGYGYQESPGNGSSHLIYRAPNKPTLSIPNTRELSPGTKRNLLKLVLGDSYYNR